MNPVAIEVKDLVRRFGAFTAVDRISFEVATGEVFGFLGPNGAGKSTTIKVLNGILAPTSGSARILGLEVPRDNARLKQSIGYMSQKFSLYEELTATENLQFFGSVYGLKRADLRTAIDRAAARFDLDQFRNLMARDLPSGARQRLALACALLHDPGVLFLDEPTSGMDPASRRRFWELVHELAAQHKTILVTTHYLDEAEYCNRLSLINRGRIVAEGTPAQVRSLARAAALTVVCSPLNKGLAALLAHAELGEATIFGDSLRLVTPDPDLVRAALPAILSEAGVRLDALRPDQPTLEDVFVQLVQESNA